MALQDSGERFSATATNATSSVATKTGVAGKTIYVTDIAGSSDKATAQIIVKDGSTVVWQLQIFNAVAFFESFQTPIKITVAATATVTVDSTALGFANIGGFVI